MNAAISGKPNRYLRHPNRITPGPFIPPVRFRRYTISAMTRVAVTLLAFRFAALAADPQPVFLWPNGAPGSAGKTAEEKVRSAGPNDMRIVSSVHRPSITPYLPSKETATGAAVIV